MKRIGILMALLLLVSMIPVSYADQNENDFYLFYDVPCEGMVISTSATVRAAANISSKDIGKFMTGEKFQVVGITLNGFYIINWGYEYGKNVYAYVMQDYVILNPSKLVVNELTYVYAGPFTNNKKNGQAPKGREYTLLYETEKWYVVAMNDKTPGSGFISKSANVYVYSPYTRWQEIVPKESNTTQQYYVPAIIIADINLYENKDFNSKVLYQLKKNQNVNVGINVHVEIYQWDGGREENLWHEVVLVIDNTSVLGYIPVGYIQIVN